ncbi:MAG: exo-alpha-sialidase, partial [bacterium]|nr:exo-alpha-sialidase [bacterium]
MVEQPRSEHQGTTRRRFLEVVAAALPFAGCRSRPLITSVEQRVIWGGRQTGETWFHPRACRIPGDPPTLLMAVQTISGSDVFGPVHFSESNDDGLTWTAPQPIPGLGRRTHPDGMEEGVCDTVPSYHPPTGSVLCMGWNVYYQDGKLTRPNEQRWPVYVVRRPDGNWTAPRKLDWPNPEAARIYGSNCSQRLTLPGGDLLIPMTFAPYGREDRAVGTVRCS